MKYIEVGSPATAELTTTACRMACATTRTPAAMRAATPSGFLRNVGWGPGSAGPYGFAGCAVGGCAFSVISAMLSTASGLHRGELIVGRRLVVPRWTLIAYLWMEFDGRAGGFRARYRRDRGRGLVVARA